MQTVAAYGECDVATDVRAGQTIMKTTAADNGEILSQNRSSDVYATTIPAVMVTTSRSVSNTAGGVGICAQEYLRTLEAAGFRLEFVTFDADRRLLVRLKRKLWPQSYVDMIPPFVASEAATVARKIAARFVFLHMTDTAPLAGFLKTILGPDVQIVLLSHGTESADYLHKLRTRKELAAVFRPPHLRQRELARQLCVESSQRQHIDYVLCLSPVEANLESWLGARAVTWVPRMVTSHPLPWNPVPGRIGFVGALDHEPNAEGLLLFAKALEAMAPEGLRLRVVGAPEKVGRTFAEKFRFIEYLGRLNDTQLEMEAATWNCFVHPIFCYPRGCSTKLAVALGWHIPVVSTPGGCRGYAWSAGELPIAQTPEGLARLAISMLDHEAAAAARQETQRIAASAPSLDKVAAIIRGALLQQQTADWQSNPRSQTACESR
jgi:hypothetical protein